MSRFLSFLLILANVACTSCRQESLTAKSQPNHVPIEELSQLGKHFKLDTTEFSLNYCPHILGLGTKVPEISHAAWQIGLPDGSIYVVLDGDYEDEQLRKVLRSEDSKIRIPIVESIKDSRPLQKN